MIKPVAIFFTLMSCFLGQTNSSNSSRFPDDLRESPFAPFQRKLCEKCVESVSMIQLIATPERFNHQLVRVEGYTSLEFEEYAIYFSRSDYEDFNTNNSLWISFGENALKSGKERQECKGKLVVLEGIFNAGCHGHMGSFSGCIENITRIQQMRTRSQLEDAVQDNKKR